MSTENNHISKKKIQDHNAKNEKKPNNSIMNSHTRNNNINNNKKTHSHNHNHSEKKQHAQTKKKKKTES